ncbi:MAG: YitT family protein [Oscillospiraceae bacterium]|nr:YitT family protein [Oscillospiraceae bacterium]
MADNSWKTAKTYLLITLICLPYAFCFNYFYAANGISCGGFTGLAQIVCLFVPSLSVGAVALFLNLPLFVLGLRCFGTRFLLASIYAVTVSSFFIDAIGALCTFDPLPPMLAALYGGAALGAALGALLLAGATTGGTELGAKLLRRRFPHISIGRLCLFIDVAVITAYAVFFGGIESALYGGAALYVASLVMDAVVYGTHTANFAFIISQKSEAIANALVARGMGATVLRGAGAFTGCERGIILCAMRRREIMSVKRIVNETDKNAFLIVGDAREILGEGFEEYERNAL